jgi:hypothetical protein
MDKRDKHRVMILPSDVKERGEEESAAAEGWQMLSLLFGFVAFFFKIKMLTWTSLFFFLVSVANVRVNNKFQHILTGCGVIIVGFISTYLQPQQPPR